MNTTKNWVMRHLPYIGTAVLLCGIFCLIAKALSPEYLDAQGYLHENFFLLPISFALLLAAVLLFLGAGLLCSGIALFLVFGFNQAARGILLLSKQFMLCIKALFKKKEEAA